MPSSLPAICANTVSEPCPISTVPAYIDRLASSLSFITAQEIEGVIVALIMHAKPLPLLVAVPCSPGLPIFLAAGLSFSVSPCLPISLSPCFSFFSQPIQLAPSFKPSLSPTPPKVPSVTNLSPSFEPLCIPSPSGSILNPAAMISICHSTAHADRETPKPRNAPAGGLLV